MPQVRPLAGTSPQIRFSFLTLVASSWLGACGPGGSEGGGSGGANTGGAVGSSGGAVGSSGGAVGSSGGAVGSSGGAVGSSGGAVGSSGGATASGGNGSGGGAATGGRGGTNAGTGGRGTGGAATGGRGGATGGSGSGGAGGSAGRFSFFVTSVDAMKRLSANPLGFGGDLRYGEATGLAGADKICREIAEAAMAGAGQKTWRAFLSTTKGGDNDGPVHAMTRIGEGPWYDRLGRVVAMNKTSLMMTRPQGADPAIINDLPNENGTPNHSDGAPGCTGNACPDNHDILTGTGTNGMVYSSNWSVTCHDWTSKVGSDGKPRCGHSWPRGVQSWISILDEAGCAPGINLVESGPPNPNDPTVGSGGGYGGIYCFALTP